MACKNKCVCEPKSYYELKVPVGKYYSDNIFFLLWEVIKHRTSHLIKHGRWMD